MSDLQFVSHKLSIWMHVFPNPTVFDLDVLGAGFTAQSTALWLSRRKEWVRSTKVAIRTAPPKPTRFAASQRSGLATLSACFTLTRWFAFSTATTGDHQRQTPHDPS